VRVTEKAFNLPPYPREDKKKFMPSYLPYPSEGNRKSFN